jgi:hypothetical protein
MRQLALLLALAAAALMGCSAHPAASSSRSEAAPIDLGYVAVPDQRTNYHYSLSGGRDCQLTLTGLPDGQVLVEALVVQEAPQARPQGDKLLGRPRAQARPGERVTLPIGEGVLTLTLKAKASQQP